MTHKKEFKMKRSTTVTGRFFAIITVIAVICTLFATFVSANAIEEGQVYYVWEDGTLHNVMPRASCGCSDPDVHTYKTYHRCNPTTGCYVGVREFCLNCHWYYDVEAVGVGGCSSMASLPNWPSKYDQYID